MYIVIYSWHHLRCHSIRQPRQSPYLHSDRGQLMGQHDDPGVMQAAFLPSTVERSKMPDVAGVDNSALQGREQELLLIWQPSSASFIDP